MCVRRVTSSVLVCSLSSHRHSYTSYLYLSLYWFIINSVLPWDLTFSIYNKQHLTPESTGDGGGQSEKIKSDRGFFHYLHKAFSVQVKSKVGLALVKVATLRITLNLDGTPILSKSHTHPSHSQTSRLLTSSLSLGIPVPRGNNKQDGCPCYPR